MVIDHLALVARGFVAALFALAVVSKVVGPAAFLRFATGLRPLTGSSPRLALAAGALLVLSEVATVALLVHPGWFRLGFCLATGQLLVFIAVIARAVRRGVFAECRCFGGPAAALSTSMIVRNALLLVPASFGALAPVGAVGQVGVAVSSAAGALAAWVFTRYYDRAAAWAVPGRAGRSGG